MPLAGASAIERVRVSPSGSTHASGTATAVSTRVRRETSSQRGGPVSVIVAVAAGESAVPSEAVKVNVSSPRASASGV